MPFVSIAFSLSPTSTAMTNTTFLFIRLPTPPSPQISRILLCILIIRTHSPSICELFMAGNDEYNAIYGNDFALRLLGMHLIAVLHKSICYWNMQLVWFSMVSITHSIQHTTCRTLFTYTKPYATFSICNVCVCTLAVQQTRQLSHVK